MMKKQVYSLLTVVILTACNSPESDNKEILSVTDQEITANKQVVTAPDTSSWLTLLDRTTATSYNPGYSICARLVNSYRNNDNKEQDVIVTNIKLDKR